MKRRRASLLAACLTSACLAAMVGGEAAALAAGPPTAITSYNTPEPNGKARVLAYLNPQGSAVTDCRFEYGPSEAYGQEAACEGAIGSGENPVEVTAHLAGLKAGATYHYRLSAANAQGPVSTPDATFTVLEQPQAQSCPNPKALGAGLLGDCRAWEMVSPPDKNGGETAPDTTRARIAPDGSAASFGSLTVFGDSAGTGTEHEYLSIRMPAGWRTHGLAPVLPPGNMNVLFLNLEPHYDEMSEDLRMGIYKAWKPLPGTETFAQSAANLYLRNDLRTPGVGDYALLTPCLLCAQKGPLSSSALAQPPFFIDATPDFSHILFESKLNLVAPATGIKAKLYESDHGVLRLAGILPNGSAAPNSTSPLGETDPNFGGPTNAISPDGSKVLFKASGDLFLRTNASETVQLNVPEGAPAGPGEASFAVATPDLSRIFFTSSQQLTPEAGSYNNLYMYDTTKPDSAADNLTYIGTSVWHVIGASADGDTVYFISADALFAWHRGELRFLSVRRGGSEDMRDTVPLERVSADGQILFETSVPVGPTGRDQGHDCRSKPCGQFYLYDPFSEALQCVSCDPGGAIPHHTPIVAEAEVGGAVRMNHAPHPLTADGSKVFFTTADALSPVDTNGHLDAYEFDARTGTVALISSGEDASDSFFMEASPSGNDVLFTTRERLSGWDVDVAYDFYDARVDGGLPEPSPPAPSCQGDACQPTPLELNDPTPSSSLFHGLESRTGRRPNAHCSKGKRRVRNAKGKSRCVRKRPRHHRAQHKRANHKRRAAR